MILIDCNIFYFGFCYFKTIKIFHSHFLLLRFKYTLKSLKNLHLEKNFFSAWAEWNQGANGAKTLKATLPSSSNQKIFDIYVFLYLK